MNSMPEPNQTGDQINDSRTPAERLLDETAARWKAESAHEEIVRAAQIALAYFQPETPEQVAGLLSCWVRRPEMTDADLAEVCERMFPKELPLMDCPSWCTTDHSGFTYDEIENLCEHDREVLVETNEAGSVKLQVLVTVTDDLTARYRHPGGILVLTDEPLPVDQAIRMIGAVTEGLRILTSA